jgi:hypothetical protein
VPKSSCPGLLDHRTDGNALHNGGKPVNCANLFSGSPRPNNKATSSSRSGEDVQTEGNPPLKTPTRSGKSERTHLKRTAKPDLKDSERHSADKLATPSSQAHARRHSAPSEVPSLLLPKGEVPKSSGDQKPNRFQPYNSGSSPLAGPSTLLINIGDSNDNSGNFQLFEGESACDTEHFPHDVAIVGSVALSTSSASEVASTSNTMRLSTPVCTGKLTGKWSPSP